ncbi:MAG TPA: aspartate kinase, partial [Rhizomicrobium sp.]|nr:aspartate kinase [Rhizomicrobium sp.]
MATIAMKFGGTSVADIERIRHVAGLVKQEVERGNKVAVVVSAMAGETNKLVAWTNDAARPVPGEGQHMAVPDQREYDVVVAAGEQITSGLLAITLNAMGVKARSWLGWQVPINTSAVHGAARIEGVPATDMQRAVEAGEVAVVAGFQGVAPGTRISTLGRGGSDTSAVAVAAGIGASRCDIYTDVDGVYTTDPRIVPKARRLEKIAYEEMLEMAS